MTETTMVEAREQLVSDMRAVIADAEELLSATSGAAGERVAAARARAEATLRDAREKLANLDDVALEQAKQLARGADGFVRENPWGAVGIAAVAGVLLGVMISRR